MTTVALKAPAGFTGLVQTRNGNNYTVDAQGFIAAQTKDVVDLLAAGFLFDNLGAVVAQNNLSASADPLVTDDSSKDYGVGSVLVNTTGKRSWLCVDPTAGAAVWVLLSQAGTAAVAAAGSSQSDAAALTASTCVVTGADGTKGVKLPVAEADLVVVVQNNDATHALPVYPSTGGNVNALSANAAFTVGPGRTAAFVGRSATQWYADPMAAATATPAEFNKLSGVGAQVASGAQAAHVAAISIGAVTGVDGTGSNAASKADVDTAFGNIVTFLNALNTDLQAFKVRAAS